MSGLPSSDGMRVHIAADGSLVLTVRPEAVDVCPQCPDFHITLSAHGTAANLRILAAGLCHLADHLEPAV